jgi:DnaA family protein
VSGPGTPAAQLPLPFPLPHLSFGSFWAGANQALFDQLQRVAGGAEERAVLIWGGPGTGKSHLLQAVCNRAGAVARRAAYVPLAQRALFGPALLEGLDEMDVVCVDDLECAAGEPGWEQALFGLFNRIRDARRSLVLAADRAPAALPLALPDLKSRLSWDLVFRIEPLDEAERFAALRHRASQRGMEIPDEVLRFLSRRIARDPHTLFRWLERLDRESLAAQKKLTVPFVKDLLERNGPQVGSAKDVDGSQ